jgi:uncharacterized protein (TIGR02147 family)
MRDYRDILKNELERRANANPRYSLRAFARDLATPPSRLSEILNGRRGLSEDGAARIARKLKLAGLVKDSFLTSVAALHGRSAARREVAARRFAEVSGKIDELGRKAAFSKVIVGWYHGAVQHAVRLRDFQPEARWIARRIGILEAQATAALRYLQRLGHLEEQHGKLILGPSARRDESGLPQTMLRLDRDGLLAQAPDDADFAGLTVAIEAGRLEEARQAVRACQRALLDLSEASAKPDALYTLAIQLFEQKGSI